MSPEQAEPPWRTIALLPVRALEGAKSRLGAALDAEERRDLVVGLLRRTLTALRDADRVDATIVVSSDEEVLDIAREAAVVPLRQLGGGLNAALDQSRAVAVELGADEVIVVPGDLPAISASAVDSVLRAADDPGPPAPPGGRAVGPGDSRPVAGPVVGPPAAPVSGRAVVLVTDRHGRGTNALVLRPPDVIPFAFGGDSRVAHAALAAAAGATYVEVPGPLRLDLDTPDDLLLVEGEDPEHDAPATARTGGGGDG